MKRQPTTTGCVHANGCDLYYEENGAGTPILLIHPAGSTATTWGTIVDELSQIGSVMSNIAASPRTMG
jgi:hypothetical protein